jgi:hypothetical protein
MSDSTVPGPPATRRRRAGLLCFWLLMTRCSVWVENPGIGLAGGGWADDDDDEEEIIRCPECKRPARLQADGSYKCALGHVSTKQPGGS